MKRIFDGQLSFVAAPFSCSGQRQRNGASGTRERRHTMPQLEGAVFWADAFNLNDDSFEKRRLPWVPIE